MNYRFRKRYLRLGFPVFDHVTASLAGLWRRPPPRAPRRVLLVRLDHLGDAVLTTAMLAPMRQAWPPAEIDVLASPWNGEVFRRHPAVGRLWILEGNWFDRSRRPGCVWTRNRPLLQQLRSRSYDLGLDPRGDARIALLLAACIIPHRVGYSGGGGAALLTWPVRWNPRLHEARRCVDLLQAVGISGAPARPYLRVTDDDRRQADALLAAQGAAGRGARAVVHLGAGTPAKQWPADRWAALVRQLVRSTAAEVLLVGAAADLPLAETVRAQAGEGVLNLAGRTDFGSLLGLLDQAALMIGCDSGPAHVAAALGTPTVVLFSGTTSWREYRPVGPRVRPVIHPVPCRPCQRRQCPVPGHPCMTGIQVEDVLAAVREVM